MDDGIRSTRLCECGCGEFTFLAKRDRHSIGVVKGQPMRFLEHHASKAGAAANFKHGCKQENSLTYTSWTMMRQRCLNKKNHAYRKYGGRGIRICERWSDFSNFLADMGPRANARMTIERIDVNGHYEPSNCKWITRGEQARNRTSSRLIDFDGKSMILSDWARHLGLSADALWHRLQQWPIERALTEPKRHSS